MRLLFKIKNQKLVGMQLVKDGHLLDNTNLTITHDFDILLIKSVDKLFHKYKIDRLSLKNVRGEGPLRSGVYVEIRGKMRSETVSNMILRTVAKALVT